MPPLSCCMRGPTVCLCAGSGDRGSPTKPLVPPPRPHGEASPSKRDLPEAAAGDAGQANHGRPQTPQAPAPKVCGDPAACCVDCANGGLHACDGDVSPRRASAGGDGEGKVARPRTTGDLGADQAEPLTPDTAKGQCVKRCAEADGEAGAYGADANLAADDCDGATRGKAWQAAVVVGTRVRRTRPAFGLGQVCTGRCTSLALTTRGDK
mmetsp:Transcript_5127/g.14356  ORF Transcript_5127/g.14356 Transcript_5127/m.14356 type:complete len:209 (+) Transcript_5127:450-1076(+)